MSKTKIVIKPTQPFEINQTIGKRLTTAKDNDDKESSEISLEKIKF